MIPACEKQRYDGKGLSLGTADRMGMGAKEKTQSESDYKTEPCNVSEGEKKT